MRLIKASQLSVLHQVFGWRGENHLSISVLAGFRLDDQGTLVDEADMWEKASQALPRGGVLDLGMPKPGGEALVLGKCFAPQDRETTGMAVFFRVGSIEKRIEVFGDRHLSGSDTVYTIRPKPFSVMDITWENAFGGPDYSQNPSGKGIEPVEDENGRRVVPLPNIEDPAHLVTSPKDRPNPAGFGPLGLDWPARLRKLGTFDRNWFLAKWPGLPDDFDFSYYQLAPPDQRVNRYFQGGEFGQLRGMHPEKHEMLFHVPSLRCRLFVNRLSDGREEFKELTPHLDTVVLIPHLETGIVIWHGTARTIDDEAGDVSHILAFHESSDQDHQPAAFYQAKLHESSEEASEEESEEPPIEAEPETDEAPLSVAGDDPAPPAPSDPPPVDLEAMSSQIREAEAGLKQALGRLGIDLDGPLPEATATAAVATAADGMAPDIPLEDRLAELNDLTRNVEATLTEQLKTLGVDLNEPIPESLKQESMVSAGAQVGLTDLFQALGVTDPEMLAMAGELTAGIAEIQAAVSRAPAPLSLVEEAAPEPQEAPERPSPVWTRETVLAGCQEKQSFAGQVLAGLDLSGCDLSGIDLSGADLEKADLSGSNLSRAKMDTCILVEANLSDAILTETSLREVNGAGAQMSGCNLTGARLDESDFTGADLSGPGWSKRS